MDRLQSFTALLAAFSWRHYQKYGKGFILIEDSKDTLKITWCKPDLNTNEVVENCDFTKYVVVKLPNGIIMSFTTIPSPEISYDLVIAEFGSSMPPNFKW